ncbi:MAG: hypothetical protein ACRYG5_15935 [Janthinobacterium lividum]
MDALHGLTINDFLLLVPMAIAGALFLGALPVASRTFTQTLRVAGAIIGALLGLLVVEGIMTLV